MALTDEDFDKLGSLRGMRVFAATIQEIGECPIVCVRGLGLHVVREPVGISHG